MENIFHSCYVLVEYIFRELTVANNHCGRVGFKSINHSIRPTFLHRANSILNINVKHLKFTQTIFVYNHEKGYGIYRDLG